MKINPFLFFISLLISGFIFYAFYSASGHHLIFSIVSAVAAMITLSASMSMVVNDAPRSTAMARTASGTLFSIMLVVNILFAYFNISNSIFIITNGIMLCLWAIAVYSIVKSKE